MNKNSTLIGGEITMRYRLLIGILLMTSVIIYACDSGSSSGSQSYSGASQPAPQCERVQVPYQTYEDLKYSIVGEPSFTPRTTGLNYYKRASLKVQNLDTETGQFVVDFYFTTLKRGTAKLSRNAVIEPTQTVEFIADYDINLGEEVEGTYEIIAGQKIVTKYREETRCY